jgi:hypothetical protein
MTQPDAPTAGAEVTIDADPAAVYSLITDLATLASLADEIATMEWRKGTSARPGAVFKGHNRNGGRQWATTCTVTERTWDQRPGWFKKPAGLTTGVPDRAAANAEHIKATLDRLKEKAES